MDTSYTGIIVTAVAAVVAFILSWTRSDATARFIGHGFVAAACVFTLFSPAPAWLLIAVGVVLVVNIGVLIRGVARA